jgi:hypothetical protein
MNKGKEKEKKGNKKVNCSKVGSLPTCRKYGFLTWESKNSRCKIDIFSGNVRSSLF